MVAVRNWLLRSVLALGVLSSSAAFAQTAPEGWSVKQDGEVWVATSTAVAGGRVQFVAWPAETSRSAFDFWFDERGLALARKLPGFEQHVVARQDKTQAMLTPPHPRLLAQTRVLQTASGEQTGVYTYGWQTPKGRQIAQIVLPAEAGQASPAYKAAFAQLTAFWKSGEVYKPAN